MQYLLIISHDDDFVPTETLLQDVQAWVREMECRGVRVHGNPLRPAGDATTVRVRGGKMVLKSGPFAKSRQKMCAYELVECSSTKEALKVASSHPMAKAATIEVRAIWSELAGQFRVIATVPESGSRFTPDLQSGLLGRATVRRWVVRFAAIVGITCSSFFPAAGQAPIPRPPMARTAPEQAAMRELWTPSETRFIRAWSVRSSGTEPAVAAPTSITDWVPLRAWGDVADLDSAGERGTVARPTYAIAAAEIRRPAATEGSVAIFVSAAARVWLNGVPIGRIEPAGGSLYPVTANLPARFRAGANLLAVEVENRGEPWRLQAALVDKGLEPPRPAQLAETLTVKDTQLGIGIRGGLPEAVHVDVLGPGGRPTSSGQAVPGGKVTFDTLSWPDGPYEIRLRSADAFGKPLHSFHSWFKGDAGAIATRIRAEAIRQGGGGDAARWRLLGQLLDRAGDDPETFDSIAMEAAELAIGSDAAVRSSGFLRLAWIDDVDGSDQFCRVYLPPDYNGHQRWPAILNLHGFNPANPPYSGNWGVTARHHPAADRFGVIWIEPHGRGNAQYMGIGEKDVLRCLSEARLRLAVDPERIYLTGESMGGSGTWLIGSRHPSLFAAIAPVFGGWDFRLHPHGPFSNPDADRPMERWVAEAHSSFAGAEQLANTPVLVQHGDADESVDVEFSRHIVTRLQRWGYDVRYREYPGRGHEDLGNLDLVVPWLLGHRLDSAPRRVRVRSVDLAGARASWLEVVAAEAPLRMIEADAELLAPGQVRIDTRNVGAMRLRLPDDVRAQDGTVDVVWNGSEARYRIADDGTIVLSSGGGSQGPVKRIDLPGGLSHVFATPFVIVVGTTARDPAMVAQVRIKAEELVARWQGWQHVRPRIVDDVNLTEADAAAYSLVLIGDPAANMISRRFASRLPLTIDRDRVIVDGREFRIRDAAVQMVRPNPLNGDRYVMVVAGTSADGLWLWNAAQFWRPVTGQPTNFYDWTIIDGRVPALAPGLSEERGWVASGVFDMRWRRTDELTFLGDPTARAAAPLRRMSDRGLDLPPDLLRGLAGHYRLEGTPAVLEVRERDGRLELTDPDGLSMPLLARSSDRFVTEDLGLTVTFAGAPHCAVLLEARGERKVWRRLGQDGGRCTSEGEPR
ncbi:prolyl oligopeptidase family serine peptidase [Pseudoxanthomonas wuyuanensis]